ncbi:hypothetical protein G7Z17_g7565 [Cylindrodendrum hubeiense]|uniref:AAA+ ATPase domain-containing protein n=1 Tax=Cylindrodendrum hubeiense TaxID=595255 RepID=A0A9P5L796_9HYPO|nr:hypothetical protein G7Z17_g7565 [Cylindrodendrum hubeiense]
MTDNLIRTISQLQVENEILKKKLDEVKTIRIEASSAISNISDSIQPSETLLYESFHAVLPFNVTPEMTQRFYRDVPCMFKGDTKTSKPRGRFLRFESLTNEKFLLSESPYLFFYFHNKTPMELQNATCLDEQEKQHLQVLLGWMEDNARGDWNEANEIFSQGKVNLKHYKKLFRPGELIIWPNHRGEEVTRAGMVDEFPHIYRAKTYGSYSDKVLILIWDFNGKFVKGEEDFELLLPKKKSNRGPGLHIDDELVDILDLPQYPLRFAKAGLEMELIARGDKFWQLIKRKLACFKELDDGDLQAERRCMIDYAMYKRLHPSASIFKFEYLDVEHDWMEEPPEDIFLACLPPKILVFDFSKKTWMESLLSRITDVTWNKAAFKQLVVPEETKELIMAMVTTHGQRSSTALDIIEGKGQGLLMLLHGGPGTGKTLTAESIAELQERSLYRVTCGDIGIEPREVEQYLGDVLELGRAWGCVVLLDEADVFLEERSFTDQKRNAVISIFLRVLEYYDRILILTTNRVGSFDEAFKSRIQLALGYPKLNEEDRLKIWHNFVQMLSRSGERFDMEDLRMNLPRLSRIDINGRQIRNAVTMARQLAKYRGEMLRAKHMQDAVRSVEKFNEYLSDVKGIQDDERARGLTLR